MKKDEIMPPNTIQDVLEWQGQVKKPRALFSRDDALTFWDLVKGNFGKRVWRDGIAEFTQVVIEVGDGIGLRIQSPSSRTRLLTDLLPFDFDRHDGWENQALQSEQLVDILTFEDSTPVVPAQEGEKEEKKQFKMPAVEESDDDWMTSLSKEEDKPTPKPISTKTKSGTWEGEVQESFDSPIADDNFTPKEKNDTLMQALRNKSALTNVSDKILFQIEAWFRSTVIGNREHLVRAIDETKFDSYEVNTFQVEETPCVLATLYSINHESVSLVGTNNAEKIASHSVAIGTDGVGESVLFTKTTPKIPANIVLHTETAGRKSISVLIF